MPNHHLLNGLFSHGGREKYPWPPAALNWVLAVPNLIHTYIAGFCLWGGGQLSVPCRYTAVYNWLLTASVTSGRGDPALLSWVNPVLRHLGLPLLVGLGSTRTFRCRQTCPALAKFDRQASLGTGCWALP